MMLTLEAIVVVAVLVFFSVEGFSGNVALSVILSATSLVALAMAGFTVYQWRRANR